NVLYTEVDWLGTYAIMDMEMWFEFLEANVEYEEEYEDEAEEESEETTEVQLSIPLMGAGNSTNPDKPITYSFPEMEFVEQETPAGYWNSVVYGDGMFVAVGYPGIITSPDGINWTLQETPANNNYWHNVAYGNGMFVVVGDSRTGNGLMTSPDGVNWTLHQVPGHNNWYNVAYGNGIFVVTPSTTSGIYQNNYITSRNGTNWTLRELPDNKNYWGITYGNGLFVAVALAANEKKAVTSPDGISWTLHQTPGDDDTWWYGVTYGNGMYVAVGYSNSGKNIMTSPDGASWTLLQNPDNVNLRNIAYGNGMFIATGYNNGYMTSVNGIDWTLFQLAYGETFNNITYGDGKFVVVGNNMVWTSSYEPRYEFTLGSSWRTIRLDDAPNANRQTDTDGDTIPDWDEIAVESSLIQLSANGSYIERLPTIQDCINYAGMGNSTFLSGLDRFMFGVSSAVVEVALNKKVLPIDSDPGDPDTDGDGILDYDDIWGHITTRNSTDPRVWSITQDKSYIFRPNLPTINNNPSKWYNIVKTGDFGHLDINPGTTVVMYPYLESSNLMKAISSKDEPKIVQIVLKTGSYEPEYWLKVKLESGIYGFVQHADTYINISEYLYAPDKLVYPFRDDTVVGNRMATAGYNYTGHAKSAIDINAGKDLMVDEDGNQILVSRMRLKEYPIYSPITGTVITSVNYDGNFPSEEEYNAREDKTISGYGNYVKIENKDYIMTLAHFEFVSFVSVGDKVTPHTMLGIAGNTGWSEEYHLHLEIYNKRTREYEYPKYHFKEIN
ncbi:MAG: peptidoglycan DD-metalloendopeptidase family protein, partial [Oscillospiraceae bacterium]|nr:peptidoglycan DD-metalloendopeptidase family protein [Oscillospiraceae bacterium]